MIRSTLIRALVWLQAFCWVFPAVAASELTYIAHEPTVKSAHPPLILLLHGRGADERDMITMWPQLPPQLVVISPRGPFADAGGGYRWYRRSGNRAADIAVSRKVIDLMLENALQRFDADPKRVFIAGFSQGAVMTYEVALREPGRFRGAAVLSGSILSSGFPKADRTQDSFFIGHGTADDRIPFGAAAAARAALETLGVPMSFHRYAGMRHETGEAEIKDFSAWLTERLAGPAALP